MAPLSVSILYNKANPYGLQDDAQLIERLLKHISIGQTILKPKFLDPREPLIHCDIQIHLEVPVYAAIPWAHTNILLVNPDQWSISYDAYVHAFDALLFRDSKSKQQFQNDLVVKGIAANHLYTIPWCASWKDVPVTSYEKEGFVCFLGGSTNKSEYLLSVLSQWRSSDPSLTIYTARQDLADKMKDLPDSITVICEELQQEKQRTIMSQYKGHLIVSQAEAFGYAAANAEVAGSFSIMNRLPVFTETYTSSLGIAWLSNEYTSGRHPNARPTVALRQELEAAFASFQQASMKAVRKERQAISAKRLENVVKALTPLFHELQILILKRSPSRGVVHCPPLLQIADCPSISIITPTYNRKKLIEIAFHNLLATDYPQGMIEWIVIEDNEKTPHMVTEKIMNFQIQVPAMKMKYIPIEGRMTIGEKRNLAIEQASHDIILFMDDDDHYPSTSFRRRVAWLTQGVKRGQISQSITCCTTLALYDLQRGTSAVNVPPMNLPFSQRISEATLTFYKSAWEERKFPAISVAEGEGWIEGRENQVLEMPPQQIIVAFTHGENQTSRRVPADQPPSCFWGFPKEYLIFIHELAGVQIEEDKRIKKPSK